MKHNVLAPSVGESITEVSILKWAKQDGQAVKVGDLLLEIESDKATVEIVAESAGVLKILKPAGERIPIGAVIGEIDDAATATASAGSAATAEAPRPTPSATTTATAGFAGSTQISSEIPLSPAVKKIVTEQNLDPSKIQGTGKDGRLTKGDVLGVTGGGASASGVPSGAYAAGAPTPAPMMPRSTPTTADRPGTRRVPMSLLRTRIAERLVQAQHTAAILTTFNEVDLSQVMALRARHKDAFKAKHGVGLGFMSFFTRASVIALKAIPEVNATIEGKDIVYRDYMDVGIAVGTDRGLVVPVLRDTQNMTFVDIERKIIEFAEKAKAGKLSIQEMSGGTFTISNGGTYGSLLSTPILNPPQSGILGMHKTQERPVAINGKVEIRPMMYVALSYDHRLIDGKGAVTFLVTLKDALENPEKLGLDFL